MQEYLRFIGTTIVLQTAVEMEVSKEGDVTVADMLSLSFQLSQKWG